MALASDGPPARHRLRIELWSWSAWLVLAVVSYPAVLLISLAPRAGLLAGLVAGLLVVYAATLGYSRRRELERWLLPSLLSSLAALAVAAIAFAFDRVGLGTAALCGLVLGAETVFIWHFLPWLVHDADSPDAPPGGLLQPRTPATGRRAPLRASLSFLLLLALLVFGLGAVWSAGEPRVPGPAIWIVALGLLALSFMFVERLAFFERSSREGNLLLAPRAYRKWFATALCTLLLLGGLVAVAPILRTRASREAARAGAAPAEQPAAAALRALDAVSERALAAMALASAAASSLPRGGFSLLLLLLLLLLALLLIYLFRRTRPVRRLRRALSRLALLGRRLWGRLLALLEKVRRARPAPSDANTRAADPLLDPFETLDSLAGLSAREVILRTYHLLLNFAEMLGQGRRQGQTPFEYAHVLAASAPSASQSLLALTWAYAGAMYGGESFPLPEIAAIRDSWQRVSSALTASLTPEELDLRRRAYLAARRLDTSPLRLHPERSRRGADRGQG